MKIFKNKDNWIDKITDNQIIWFLKNYFDVITVECIKRNNIQIIVDVHMLYVMEAEKVSMPERLFISPYHIACNEFSESNQDGNWEKYLFSLGIHPLQLNNSFMKGK